MPWPHFYQTRSAWSKDQGSNENHSPVHNFAPTVTKFCVMWEEQALPQDTKFGNCRDKIVDSRAFLSWSLILGSSWSGLIKLGPVSSPVDEISFYQLLSVCVCLCLCVFACHRYRVQRRHHIILHHSQCIIPLHNYREGEVWGVLVSLNQMRWVPFYVILDRKCQDYANVKTREIQYNIRYKAV